MAYRAGGREFVVIATGGGEDAALVAFALPTTDRAEEGPYPFVARPLEKKGYGPFSSHGGRK
jgi:hypothetical protein